MADGVVVIGADGQIELLNPAGQKMLGVRSQTPIGARFIELVRDHDLQRLVSLCRGSRRNKEGIWREWYSRS